MILLVLLAHEEVRGQKMRTIRLKHKKVQTVVNRFRIDSVVDDRVDKGSLGGVMPGLHLRKMLVQLEGGPASAFHSYISKSISSPDTARPLTMYIKKLEVDERQGMTMERLTLAYSYAFYSEGQQLTQYDGESYAETSMDASTYISKLISESIEQTFRKLDDALKAQVPVQPQSITVVARVGQVGSISGNIPYSRSRLLGIEDFKGKADDLSRASAATYSGISVGYNAINTTAEIKLIVDVTPAFSPERSWCRPAARNAKTLGHEQRHFDITALYACLLIEKIRATTFTPAGFKEELDRLQTESNTLLQDAQDLYDQETSHGRIAARQLQWDKNIEAQLNTHSCY